MQNNKYIKIIEYILGGMLLVWVFVYSYNIYMEIKSPILNEYREYANVDCVLNFLNGRNSFTLDAPEISYFPYGPLFPWLCSLFYRLLPWDADVMTYMRVMSHLCTIGVAYVAFKEILKESNSKIWAAIGACVSVMSACYFGYYCTAFCNEFGVLLMCLVLYFARRVDNVKHVWGLAVLSVLCFFAKQYFLVVLVPVFLYFLFRQYKLALWYFVSCTTLLILSVVIVWFIWPLYFQESFTHHVKVSSFVFEHMINQWRYFHGQFLIFVWCTLVLFAIALKKIIDKIKDKEKIELNIYAVSIVVYSVVLLKLGGHIGTFMTYYHQILLVPLVIYVCCLIPNKIKSLYIKYSLCFFIIVLSMYRAFGFTQAFLWHDESDKYNEYYRLSADVEKNKDNMILLTPLLDRQALERNWEISNMGETEYLIMLHSDNKLFRIAERKACIGDSLLNDECNKLRKASYNLVVSDSKTDEYLIPDSVIAHRYEKYDSLNCNSVDTQIYLWRRKR